MTQGTIPKLHTIDAETLISSPLDPVPFTIDALISQGLYLLVGDSKIGKSWLTLWLCLQVAKGEQVWTFPTRKGSVLYLCLEDSYHRIQSRLFEITDDAPDTLHFSRMAQNISNGLIVQIEAFLTDHPNTVLIAIDTLQKVRGVPTDNAGAYANDYRDLGVLKELADRHRLTVLLIHHTSKRPADKSDPFKSVSGTTAIMGAADGCIIMSKPTPFEKTATLAVTGRDVENRLLTVTQNERHIWTLESDTVGAELRKTATPPVIGAVCDFVADNGDWSGTASELSALLQIYLDEKPLPQYLTSKINQFHHVLVEHGIMYQTRRTSSQRTITLSTIKEKMLGMTDDHTTTGRGQASCLSDAAASTNSSCYAELERRTA